jgi:hypothetical protein
VINSSPQGSSAAHAATNCQQAQNVSGCACWNPTAFVRTTVINHMQQSRRPRKATIRRCSGSSVVCNLRHAYLYVGSRSARGTGQPLRFSLPVSPYLNFSWSNLALSWPSKSALTKMTSETSFADDHHCLYPSSP